MTIPEVTLFVPAQAEHRFPSDPTWLAHAKTAIQSREPLCRSATCWHLPCGAVLQCVHNTFFAVDFAMETFRLLLNVREGFSNAQVSF
jgi:hypothetical protein